VPKLPERYNPATWMLEVSGGAAKMNVDATIKQDFPARYRSSTLYTETERRVEELIKLGASYNEPLSLTHRYAVPFLQQTKMVTWKMFILYWYALPCPLKDIVKLTSR
jgi:hypothetical protein